jgi:predicted transposase YbfD/YdcC
MTQTVIASIESHFEELSDPRINRRKRHKLLDIVVIAICGIICGAQDWVGIATLGETKQDWFSSFLELPNGIPSHDTFGRVFRLLNFEEFEHCFFNWINTVFGKTEGQVIPIDGKQLRHSYSTEDNKAAIHLVSAWASENGVTLGQVEVDGKSNEITAIPKLLEMLDISGCIITIDAMGCQTEIAKSIVNADGDYLLALKKNQGTLYEDVQLLFDNLEQIEITDDGLDRAETIDKDHGRIEIRRAIVIYDTHCLCALRATENFKGLKCIVQVTAERHIGETKTIEHRYYISSLTTKASHLLSVSRRHWSIENSMHWVLDVVFNEDASRIRKGNGAHNFAILRRIALNLLKHERSLKVGIANKRLVAASDNDYLLNTLSALFF